MPMLRTLLVLLTVTVGVGFGLSQPALAEDTAVHACDRLAAHPQDPDKVTPGVSTSDVDRPAAIAACRAAVAEDPKTVRYTYQLARVLFYDGQAEEATQLMAQAAEAGYRQAQFVMGAFITNGRPYVSDDLCDAEQWWAKAAKAGRQAAKVAYVRHVTKGLFDGCTLHATAGDMETFLDDVRAEARDYYLRLLLADLTEDLAAYRATQP